MQKQGAGLLRPGGPHLVRAAARDEDGLMVVLLHVPGVHAVPLPQQLPVPAGQHEALRRRESRQ